MIKISRLMQSTFLVAATSVTGLNIFAGENLGDSIPYSNPVVVNSAIEMTETEKYINESYDAQEEQAEVFICHNIYQPFSPEAIKLFEAAALLADVPIEWARKESLHHIVQKESNGRVGVPNYTIKIHGGKPTYKRGRLAYNNPGTWPEIHRHLQQGELRPRRKDDSTATGLGQLLLSNVKKYYPSGLAGMGNCVEEAAGMLAYIQDRHGNPDRALGWYGRRHEGY